MSKDKDLTPESRVGAVVRDWRKYNDLTQEDLAAAVGSLTGTPMHKTAISKIEAGQRSMSFAEAVAISKMLTVPLKDLAHPLQPVDVFQRWDRAIASFGDMARRVEDLVEDVQLTYDDVRVVQEYVTADDSRRGTLAYRREQLKALLPELLEHTRTAIGHLEAVEYRFMDYANLNSMTGVDPDKATDAEAERHFDGSA